MRPTSAAPLGSMNCCCHWANGARISRHLAEAVRARHSGDLLPMVGRQISCSHFRLPIILAIQILWPDALVGLGLVALDEEIQLSKPPFAVVKLTVGGIDPLPSRVERLSPLLA